MLPDWRPPNWRRQAPCRGLSSDDFVPEESPSEAPAIVTQLCPSCPVRAECEAYGRASASSGWWGGTFLRLGFTPKEWTRLRIWARELVISADDDPRRDLRAEIARGKPRVMTQALADEMRVRYAEGGRTRRQIAEDFKIPFDTVKQVLQYQTWRGPRRVVAGETHPRHRLSRDDVIEIRRRCAAGEAQKYIAADYGVSSTAVCNINTGRRWASVV